MAPIQANTTQERHVVPKGTVLIAGGGPVGLILARVLSSHGVKSLLFERNDSTTRWPKMDLTNGRSMELFRTLGLADDLRRQGVAGDIDQDVLVSSGLSAKEPITKWKLPGVNKFRQLIHENNDGSQPLEPWQRLSQAIFEKWLKAICEQDPMIELSFGHRVESVVEEGDQVRTVVTNVESGVSSEYVSDYVAGCDGASSRVRKSLSLPLDGGPVPVCVLLVHFKSRDLSRLHKQGRFWHIFLLGDDGGLGGAIIAQDEIDTWTTHLFLPVDTDLDKIESKEAVYRVLGGIHGQYPIEIDEVLVRSTWRPYIAVARSWSSPNHKIHIAGDAAHQNIPTGGYGMNMGIGDAFDLGWKLASVINGSGGKGLLKSYELERRPVALQNVERSGVHFQVHNCVKDLLAGRDPHKVEGDSEETLRLRADIHAYYQKHDGENQDFGIEMGYRYKSPIVMQDDAEDGSEPHWEPSRYVPTTWPGSRPPHLFLSDGTPIFDRFGKSWTLLVFTAEDRGQTLLADAAASLSVQVKVVNLVEEALAKKLYEKSLVLIRPDQHVAWRGERISSAEMALDLVGTVTGMIETGFKEQPTTAPGKAPKAAFTATDELMTQTQDFKIEGMAAFQQ